jgi:hypothetical protein
MTSNIAPDPIWPNHEVGPHKIVFALGVVSINFARFERVITWMLAATTGCEETEAETILRPLPPAEKLRRLKTAIEGSLGRHRAEPGRIAAMVFDGFA